MYSILDLFKYKSLRKVSIALIYISFLVHLIYFGGEYSISDISDGNNTYILGIFLGVAETLGYTMVSLYVTKYERKKIILGSFILSLLSICGFFFFGLSPESTKTNCNLCLKCIYKGRYRYYY